MGRGRGVDMAARRDEVVLAAREVFLRYGYARTTMNDLAAAAGLSRPVLYLVYPSKDEIFAAVLDLIYGEYVREAEAALPTLPDAAARLHQVAVGWAGAGYDLTQAHPDARDMFDLALPPVRAMYTRLAQYFSRIIEEVSVTPPTLPSSRDLADVLIFGMRGVKDIARDAADMRRLIAIQVEMVLALRRTR